MTPLELRYDTTVDDGVDLQMKVLERSGVFGRAWAQIAILAPMAGLATGIALIALPVPARATGAIATAVIVGATYLPLQRRLLRRRLRAAAIEARGGDVTVAVDVSIDDDGIHSSSRGHAMTIAWNDVEAVEADDRAIDVYAENGALASLPRAAFPTSEACEAFLTRLATDATVRSGSQAETAGGDEPG